jgi:hypothetical protein
VAWGVPETAAMIVPVGTTVQPIDASSAG